ncbi:ras family-domain-containing protein [Copromyces sp. CBS 386.78]|nr:ras family-domain-containing protein [Copromyces sp. CBS 386.78]
MTRTFGFQPCREFHIVVLGTGGVGKSCLTAQFVHNEWIESYDPTIEDSYRTQVSVDGRQVILEILDTAGTEQFVAMRDLYMKAGQGFLLVFSITSQASLDELSTLREEIIRIKDDEKIPIVMVGNKADLLDQRAVDRKEAFAISQQWNAPYYEASARTRTNVDQVFIDLCRQMLRRDDSGYNDDDDYNGGTRNGGGGGGGYGCGQKQEDGSHGSMMKKKRRRKRKGDHKCIIM